MAVNPKNCIQGCQCWDVLPASGKADSIQSDQTWGVFLGAQDCLDMALPCPSMRNSVVGPDGSTWQQAGLSDWRQDCKDDEVLKSP